ncbi:MAG: hypothetical protein J6X34_05755 [Clostridia bacterium]|nr:hypothetical protein [Clostridia bacterium]
MANDGTNKKSGEIRLVKVNSKEKSNKRYDAFGYEIPEEAPARDARTDGAAEYGNGYGNAGSNTSANARTSGSNTGYRGESAGTGSGITAPGHRYNADIRAAIESGAHRRPAENNSAERGNRDGAGRTARTGESTSQGGERVRDSRAETHDARPSAERERSGETRSGTGRNRYSHVSSRNSYDEEMRESGAEKTAQQEKRNELRRRKADEPSSPAKSKEKAAAKKKKRRSDARKEKIKKEEAQREAEREAARKEEEKKPLTAHEKRRNIVKAKRRQTIGNIFKVIAVVLVVALIIVLITVNSKKGDGINTQFVSAGYIEDAAYGKLSFLRAETPVYSAFSGVFMPDVNEGDRVGKNTVIGHVIKAEYSDALAELKEVESKIYAARKASAYVDAGKTGEMFALENAIDNEFDYLSKLAMAGTLSGYHQSFSRLDELFSQKNELEMNADNADTYISGLQKERNSILNRISSSMHEVRANTSGIISFRCDGNEGRVTEAAKAMESRISETNFTSMQSSTLTAGELASVTLPEGEMYVSSGTSVSNGSIVARIAAENSYYVTLPVDPASHHISSGAMAEIYVTADNIKFDAETVGVYYSGDEALAVFKASRALDGTISLRAEDGRIVFSHVEGLKVPLRVLSEWDTAGVTARLTILRSGYIRYAYVNVLGRDNDYAIINSRSFLDDGTGVAVRENDEYVVNYEKVYEGQGI